MALREIVAFLGYRIDRRSEDNARRSVDNLKSSVRGLVATFGLVLGAREIVRGFGRLIDLASDASEATNQLEAVFRDRVGSISESMQQLARDTNRSEFEMRSFAAQAGALLTPLTGSAEQTEVLSTNMVSLAQDISSFFNAKPADAFRALRAAAIGSTEPLLTIAGIDLRVDALKTFAKETGRSFDALDTAGKTALRFELINKRLGEQGAIGDAITTANQGANVFRGMSLIFKDVATVLGTFLLPEAERLAIGIRDLLSGFRDTNREGGVLRSTGEGLAIAFKLFGRAITIGARNLPIVLAAFGGLLILLSPMTVLLLAVGVAALAVADDFETMGEGGASVVGNLIAEFNILKEETGDTLDAISSMLETAVDFWIEVIERRFKVSLKDVGNRVLSGLGLEGGLTLAPGQSAPGQAPLAGETPIVDLGTIGGGRNVFSPQTVVEVTVNAETGASAEDIASASAKQHRAVAEDTNRLAFRSLVTP